MTEIKVNLDNLNETERQQLLELIEKANTPVVWEPKKNGETYFYISNTGTVGHTPFWNSEIDKDLISIGNCFRTPEDAHFEIERFKVIRELKQFASKNYGGKNARYYLAYRDQEIKHYITDSEFYTGDLRFSTQELAQKAINTVGYDRIKKYYFGIK